MSLSVMMMSFVFAGTVFAQPPVGIITSLDGDVKVVSDNNREADFGDDILLDDKFKIGAGGSLVITYYAGCVQETFGENALIQVGQDKSKIISCRAISLPKQITRDIPYEWRLYEAFAIDSLESPPLLFQKFVAIDDAKDDFIPVDIGPDQWPVNHLPGIDIDIGRFKSIEI